MIEIAKYRDLDHTHVSIGRTTQAYNGDCIDSVKLLALKKDCLNFCQIFFTLKPMSVVVTGIGLQSCLGKRQQSWQNLLMGKTGIKDYQPFSSFPSLPLGLITNFPSCVSQLLHQTVTEALNDAQLTPPLPDCGVVVGSSRGYQARWENWAKSIKENNFDAKVDGSWLETFPHQPALYCARQVGAKGTVLAPMAACATGIWAIAQGVELIEQGRCQRVIAGAVEAPITPLTLAGFQQMGALAKTGCYPFDDEREGLVLGEGSAILVLESAEVAHGRNARIYGEILGFGLTCDGDHVSAPAKDNQMAVLAIQQCLERSGLNCTEIDYIHAHGTGTRLNDQREAQLITEIFGQTVAVSSTKGATGHTLGASAAIGVALSLMALQSQRLPPCVGLKKTDFLLNFVKNAMYCPIKTALCLGFGFGGQNAAVTVGAPSVIKEQIEAFF